MISIKEYAKSKNVSYEAIRKQINRYKDDLEEHISKVGRTQYLDDEAVSFLDRKRAENPIIVMESDKDEEIAILKEENKNLLLKLTEVQEALLQAKDQVVIAEKQRLLLEDKEKQISQLQKKYDDLQNENRYFDREIEKQGEYMMKIQEEKKQVVSELDDVKQMNVWQFIKYKKKGNT